MLYSHSLGGERFETTCLVEDLASHGYVVVTIDHVHDADVVVLPDGSVAFCAVPAPTVTQTRRRPPRRSCPASPTCASSWTSSP